MPCRWFRSLLVVLFVALACTALHAAEEATWKVGIARAKITPKKAMWMGGYASRTKPAEGTLHDLWLKVFVLEAPDGGRALVITCDLLEFAKEHADRIVGQVSQRCNLQRAQVMLTCSHTHSGPVLDGSIITIYPLDDQQRALVAEYSRELVETAAATAAEAVARLEPMSLWAGEGKATFGANRRNNKEKDVAAFVQKGTPLKGPVDHTVPVLAMRSPAGDLRALAASYACHNTTLDILRWCGDYAGFMQYALEERHPGVTAMFYEGCGADQNPLPRRKIELCQKYGGMLADAVDEVVRSPMRRLAPRLRTSFALVPLDFHSQPELARLEKMAASKNYTGRWAQRVVALHKSGKRPEPYPYPVQVWRLGDDQLWISLGGEVVVDYALRFKAKYGPTTWVNGYANDVMGYIPSHRVWKEGGYEAGAFAVYDLPADRWCEDIEDRIAAAVDRLVQEVKGR